jgi:enoyl-CoA hydratase/carnithine racemase
MSYQQQVFGLPSAAAAAASGNLMMISREHIDKLRAKLESLPCKTPDDQEILLEFDTVQRPPNGHCQLEVAYLVIKSGAKNALSGKMISQLTERLDELERWTTTGDDERQLSAADSCLARCLLIRGHGGTFCSGSDLIAARQTTNQLAAWELAQLMQYNLRRLAHLPVVSVAHVEGYALGGGAELALAADMRLMSGEQ